FDTVLERLRTDLAAIGNDVPIMQALRSAAVSSNRYDPQQLPELRMRMTLITTVPALQAHSMLRYAAWRAVVADYVAQRTGHPVDGLIPQTIAHAALGVSTAAFTSWVNDDSQDLEDNLDRGYANLATGWSITLDR
ncbi:MAG TPA: hypothetical protein VNT22_07635, partial [Baekduia sp.]|nr:hypothetical protein [Baekduia sp.]